MIFIFLVLNIELDLVKIKRNSKLNNVYYMFSPEYKYRMHAAFAVKDKVNKEKFLCLFQIIPRQPQIIK